MAPLDHSLSNISCVPKQNSYHSPVSCSHSVLQIQGTLPQPMDLPKQHRGTNLASTNTLHDRVFCSQMEKYILRFCWTTKKMVSPSQLKMSKTILQSCFKLLLFSFSPSNSRKATPLESSSRFMRSGEKWLPWKQNDLNWRHFVLGQGMHLWRHSGVPLTFAPQRITNAAPKIL